MPKQIVVNRSFGRRWWADLVNADSGRTLELDPGESAPVDIPDGFTDPWLEVVKPPKTVKKDAE